MAKIRTAAPAKRRTLVVTPAKKTIRVTPAKRPAIVKAPPRKPPEADPVSVDARAAATARRASSKATKGAARAEPDWKAIALALAERVNFAIMQLSTHGSGILFNFKTGHSRHWRRYMAEGLLLIPGTKLDEDVLDSLAYPPKQRAKALQELRAKRAAAEAADGKRASRPAAAPPIPPRRRGTRAVAAAKADA